MEQESIVKNIAEKLKKYPTIRFKKNSKQKLTIFSDSDDGFDIALYSDGQENTLFFAGFHEHFETAGDDTESLLQLLLYGLTGAARVKEFSKKGKPYKYILQVQNEKGEWIDSGTTGHLFFRYWSKTSIRYLQNHLLSKEQIFPELTK